jgi:hypothetical protein
MALTSGTAAKHGDPRGAAHSDNIPATEEGKVAAISEVIQPRMRRAGLSLVTPLNQFGSGSGRCN